MVDLGLKFYGDGDGGHFALEWGGEFGHSHGAALDEGKAGAQ